MAAMRHHHETVVRNILDRLIHGMGIDDAVFSATNHQRWPIELRQFIPHPMALCAPHRFKQGSPPRLTGKLLFVVFHNSRTGATMIEERAFDQSLEVLGPRPLHDRESL